MVRLRVESAGKTREVETDETVLTIGRASRNTLEIHDDQSSREHCRLERRDDGSWTLTDLASRNGTLLNDQPIDQAPLRHGDLIRIGTTTIRFELPQADHAAAEAAEAQREAAQEAGEQAPEAIKLVLATGPSRGKAVLVAEKLTTIGRRPNNDIVLAGRGVSNRHAEIRRGPDGFILVDEGSRNGTFLNGRLDLSQAEAVLDIVQAKTAKALETAVYQLDGRLSEKINALVDRLRSILMHLEASIDVSDELTP